MIDPVYNGWANDRIEVEQQIAELEQKVRHGQTLRRLLADPGFIEIVKDLEAVARTQVKALMSGELTPFQLGQRQGFIRGLRILANTQPISDEEMERIEKVELPSLRDRLQVVTNLLRDANSPRGNP